MSLFWYNLYTYIEGIVGIEYTGVLLDAFNAYRIISSLFRKQGQMIVANAKWNATLIKTW